MATNILKKYERSAGEVAKIFSDIGLGQAVIAMKIKDLIDTATSDTVRLNALALAAKCVGMAREVEVQPQRISIILNVGNGPKPDPAAGRPALAYQGKMSVPGKPLAITK
ncbi:MAG: hypothetical protein NTY36_00615 [Deltaproteobacteria bacterium]|nr:hypothetical protein [Deltaproteobacteria bacterium]